MNHLPTINFQRICLVFSAGFVVCKKCPKTGKQTNKIMISKVFFEVWDVLFSEELFKSVWDGFKPFAYWKPHKEIPSGTSGWIMVHHVWTHQMMITWGHWKISDGLRAMKTLPESLEKPKQHTQCQKKNRELWILLEGYVYCLFVMPMKIHSEINTVILGESVFCRQFNHESINLRKPTMIRTNENPTKRWQGSLCLTVHVCEKMGA